MDQVGKLDRQITLQFRAQGQTGSGEPIETWGGDAVVWARVQPLSGREYWSAIAAQIHAEEMLIFTIRWRSDVRPGTARVNWDPGDGTVRSYNVRRVVELGRREQMDIYADTFVA